MRKFIILTILIILDLILYIYLLNIQSNQNAFQFEYINKPLIYQKKNIELNNIDEFNFDDYFEILDFNNATFKYLIDEKNKTINVTLNGNDFKYNYCLIEPEIIIEKEYITETIYIDNSEYCDYEDNNIYYDQDYYEFSLGTDLSTIIQVVQDDVISYTNVTCDYSCLNPYELGEYDIYFYNDYQKITKTIKII